MATLDEINPAHVGEDRIGVQLASSDAPLANTPIRVDFSYDKADPEGVVLPLEVIVSGPDEFSDEREFRLLRPSSIEFDPPSAGSYLVLIREKFHNRWQGRLTFEVEGDPLTSTSTGR